MSKEKEIEEMAKTLCCAYGTAQCDICANICGVEYCEKLYDAGYRKIVPNVDFVVRVSDLVNVREKAYNDARKETAKEILLQLKKDCPHNYFAVISFIVKQENIYGVEIDENDGT